MDKLKLMLASAVIIGIVACSSQSDKTGETGYLKANISGGGVE